MERAHDISASKNDAAFFCRWTRQHKNGTFEVAKTDDLQSWLGKYKFCIIYAIHGLLFDRGARAFLHAAILFSMKEDEQVGSDDF